MNDGIKRNKKVKKSNNIMLKRLFRGECVFFGIASIIVLTIDIIIIVKVYIGVYKYNGYIPSNLHLSLWTLEISALLLIWFFFIRPFFEWLNTPIITPIKGRAEEYIGDDGKQYYRVMGTYGFVSCRESTPRPNVTPKGQGDKRLSRLSRR